MKEGRNGQKLKIVKICSQSGPYWISPSANSFFVLVQTQSIQTILIYDFNDLFWTFYNARSSVDLFSFLVREQSKYLRSLEWRRSWSLLLFPRKRRQRQEKYSDKHSHNYLSFVGYSLLVLALSLPSKRSSCETLRIIKYLRLTGLYVLFVFLTGR